MELEESLKQLRRLLITSLLIQGALIALLVLGFSAYLNVEGYHFGRLNEAADDNRGTLRVILHTLEEGQ